MRKNSQRISGDYFGWIVSMILVLALSVWCGGTATAAQSGAGIWVYNADMSISLINLTNYPLTYQWYDDMSRYPDPGGGCASTGQFVLDAGIYKWSIAPYRTQTWGSTNGCDINPRNFDGVVTLYSEGLSNWSFDLVFKRQHAHNLAESGTWVGLSPHGTGQG